MSARSDHPDCSKAYNMHVINNQDPEFIHVKSCRIMPVEPAHLEIHASIFAPRFVSGIDLRFLSVRGFLQAILVLKK